VLFYTCSVKEDREGGYETWKTVQIFEICIGYKMCFIYLIKMCFDPVNIRCILIDMRQQSSIFDD
jgi:hypothetical protein